MSAGSVWSLPKRVAFRFGVVALAITVYPMPFGLIPKTQWIADPLTGAWKRLVVAFAEHVGLGTPVIQPTGSGDTLLDYAALLLVGVLATIGAALWSALDRKRLAYPRLADAAWTVLRYWLALNLLSYGFAKVFAMQFPPPAPSTLDQSVGELSPMGLLWTFQGASKAYTMFGGACEVIAGLLLLWRRTAILGALAAMAVLANVAMLNFCYDVPVKLLSSQLLVMAALVAWPQANRLLRAVLGRAVPELAPRPRMSARLERARVILKLLLIACSAVMIYQETEEASEYLPPHGELYGTWIVESWGAPQVPDKARWRKLIVVDMAAQIRFVDDTREWIPITMLPEAHLIVVQVGDQQRIWHYACSGDRLELDATRMGAPIHITLSREPPPLLVSRGFHWIQELPFNE